MSQHSAEQQPEHYFYRGLLWLCCYDLANKTVLIQKKHQLINLAQKNKLNTCTSTSYQPGKIGEKDRYQKAMPGFPDKLPLGTVTESRETKVKSIWLNNQHQASQKHGLNNKTGSTWTLDTKAITTMTKGHEVQLQSLT